MWYWPNLSLNTCAPHAETFGAHPKAPTGSAGSKSRVWHEGPVQPLEHEHLPALHLPSMAQSVLSTHGERGSHCGAGGGAGGGGGGSTGESECIANVVHGVFLTAFADPTLYVCQR